MTKAEQAEAIREATLQMQVLDIKAKSGAMSSHEAGNVYAILAMRSVLEESLWPNAAFERLDCAATLTAFMKVNEVERVLETIVKAMVEDKGQGIPPELAILTAALQTAQRRTRLAKQLAEVEAEISLRRKLRNRPCIDAREV